MESSKAKKNPCLQTRRNWLKLGSWMSLYMDNLILKSKPSDSIQCPQSWESGWEVHGPVFTIVLMELKMDRLRPKIDPGFTVQATFWPFLYFWASAGWRWIFKIVTCGGIWGMAYQLTCGEVWGMAYPLKRPIKSTIRRIEPWAPLVHFQTWASSKYLWVEDHILPNPLSYPTYLWSHSAKAIAQFITSLKTWEDHLHSLQTFPLSSPFSPPRFLLQCLTDSSGKILWQSFDYPTDTFQHNPLPKTRGWSLLGKRGVLIRLLSLLFWKW